MAVRAVKKERAKPADEADEAAPETKSSKRGSKSKLVLVAVLVLLVCASGGGTYWYLQHNSGPGKHEARVEPPKPPVFVPLEMFTVNLQLEENPQFLQVGLSLKVRDNGVVDPLKLHMPEVRDRTLLLLSNQKASALLTLEGKKKLADAIVATINAILDPAPANAEPAAAAQAEAAPAAETDDKGAADAGDKPAPEPAPKRPVLSVLFTSFIVQ
jgi:flagellar FliL protein